MNDDVLSRIDAVIASATSCLCGCEKPLGDGSQSPWFASEECQARWNARQVRSSYGKVSVPPTAPVTVADAVVRRMSRPSAASPWLTREDVTGRPDRVNVAFRAEVRRQGLDEETIRIEAIRPARRASVTVATPEEAATHTRMMETRSLECSRRNPMCSGCDGAAAWGWSPCLHECHEDGPVVDIQADPGLHAHEPGSPDRRCPLCPDDSHIATRTRWWQWRRRTHD